MQLVLSLVLPFVPFDDTVVEAALDVVVVVPGSVLTLTAAAAEEEDDSGDEVDDFSFALPVETEEREEI